MVVIAERTAPRPDERVAEDGAALAARRSLRAQVSRLEHELSEAVVAAFPHATITVHDARVGARARRPRLLDLEDLEALRDDLAAQLHEARTRLAERSAAQQQARELLEAMLLAPGRHRFARVSNAALGEGGCGVWAVRPRLGLIGMLMGWWHVKLSSGCPLSRYREGFFGHRGRRAAGDRHEQGGTRARVPA